MRPSLAPPIPTTPTRRHRVRLAQGTRRTIAGSHVRQAGAPGTSWPAIRAGHHLVGADTACRGYALNAGHQLSRAFAQPAGPLAPAHGDSDLSNVRTVRAGPI